MKEKILEILNKHKTEIWGKNTPDREVVDADDFELIAEEIVNNLDIPVVSQRSELLKGDYRDSFMDWKNKYFEYKPKTYEYKSKNSKERYTLTELHKRYERAMLESPFNCG